ncbi:MAG: ABC transporter permease [Desulfopila sp.]|jgi:ABC-type polysaccharide/polyol phosphate export permease|nr:ABC transporter permease [Desulfopila sp.]
MVSLTEASLKTTVDTTRLGWLWWVVSPLIMMGIYYVFVKIILGRGGENYHIFILTGIVAWQFFNNALIGTAQVVGQNAQLIKQVALPIPMLIMIPVLVQMTLAAVGVGIIMLWNIQMTGFHSLLVFPLLLLTGMTSYGLGLFISVLNVYISDISQLLQYILRMAFFLSPVLFPAERVLQNEKIPEMIKIIFHLNPMVTLIDGFRAVLIDGVFFALPNIMILFFCVVFLIQMGLVWVRRNTSQIIRML